MAAHSQGVSQRVGPMQFAASGFGSITSGARYFIDSLRSLVSPSGVRVAGVGENAETRALLSAMINGRRLDGYAISQPRRLAGLSRGIRGRIAWEYIGVNYTGVIMYAENVGLAHVKLPAHLIAPANSIHVSIRKSKLRPGASTMIWIVLGNGGR